MTPDSTIICHVWPDPSVSGLAQALKTNKKILHKHDDEIKVEPFLVTEIFLRNGYWPVVSWLTGEEEEEEEDGTFFNQI